jgi:hypothetical protein
VVQSPWCVYWISRTPRLPKEGGNQGQHPSLGQTRCVIQSTTSAILDRKYLSLGVLGATGSATTSSERIGQSSSYEKLALLCCPADAAREEEENCTQV